MSYLLALGLSAAAAATPPLPVPPPPMSAPMAPVDIGGATVVFPHGARRIPRMTPATTEMIRQMRARQAPNIDPKVREAVLTQVSQSDSWDGSNPSHAELYRVMVGPRPPAELTFAACRPALEPGYACRSAHAGAAQGTFVRRTRADGGMSETLSLYTPAKSYNVSYDRLGRASQARLHAKPGDAAAGERFIRSFRFGGQPVVIGPANH